MIAASVLTHICPKCMSPNMERRSYWYPTLGYGDSELACRLCGLLLWPRFDETPRRAYLRWLMDRIAF
ncbi:MAG: hypothetical protein M3Z41_03425 [Candidatus Eremiobacteraeota bacterium]|nr:hypothetical protein [Candidatus Eremiobacteraeota bacterium]